MIWRKDYGAVVGKKVKKRVEKLLHKKKKFPRSLVFTPTFVEGFYEGRERKFLVGESSLFGGE
jgi:hypothetical protein